MLRRKMPFSPADIQPDALPFLLLPVALVLDTIVGELGPVFRILPHPVALIGGLVAWFDRHLNRDRRAPSTRFMRGAVVVLIVVALAAAAGWGLARLARTVQYGWAIELVAVVLLLAQRSLFDHVRAVGRGLKTDGVRGGRKAVAHIVGRDPESLDEHGVARAAIESLAENFADGVVAPCFWYLLLGLPGLVVYKAINTLDSMIGHRTPRHAAFGATAARLDDAVNWLPARLAGLIVALGAAFAPGGRPVAALKVMARDGSKHRSVNAGWPEAAMAGAIGVALAGPRRYGDAVVEDAWMGEEFSARATHVDIRRALFVFAVACLLNLAVVVGLAILRLGM